MANRNTILAVQHTPEGPLVNIAEGVPREMMMASLAGVALYYSRKSSVLVVGGEHEAREAAALLEETARALRENAALVQLAPPPKSG